MTNASSNGKRGVVSSSLRSAFRAQCPGTAICNPPSPSPSRDHAPSARILLFRIRISLYPFDSDPPHLWRLLSHHFSDDVHWVSSYNFLRFFPIESFPHRRTRVRSTCLRGDLAGLVDTRSLTTEIGA
ncbi:hypothetical protein CDAR_518801 [Caerostris darwini]|uniref:Uncharacterized protein n=1 Tax=Caerostris darwini TaxID=1538125 RepID=A0AAV4PNM7_9ARAC|nr:hypothetical protein CDAR_518801 [Caerostris darwini]